MQTKASCQCYIVENEGWAGCFHALRYAYLLHVNKCLIWARYCCSKFLLRHPLLVLEEEWRLPLATFLSHSLSPSISCRTLMWQTSALAGVMAWHSVLSSTPTCLHTSLTRNSSVKTRYPFHTHTCMHTCRQLHEHTHTHSFIIPIKSSWTWTPTLMWPSTFSINFFFKNLLEYLQSIIHCATL